MHNRVVILSAFLSPFRSGAEACAEEVPLALRNDFEFIIITARLRKDLPQYDKLQGSIPVIRVGFGNAFDKWLYPFLAAREAKKHSPAVVHGILETFAGFGLLLCKWTVPKAKRILTLQTTNRTFLKTAIIRSADQVTAISSLLVDRAKKAGKTAQLIPNGIPLQALLDASQWHKKVPGSVLFVGRLEHMKGVDTLLKAFASVPTPAHLRIVGDGSQRTTLEALAQSLGLADRVTFIGKLAAPKLYDEYAQAEIFCGLSRSEALGNVFLEAQAAKCAVIATNIGGIPDIIDNGHEGILIESNNPQKASEALITLLSDQALRSQLAVHAQENAKRYDWSTISRKYAALYA